MRRNRKCERFSTNITATYSSGKEETWRECIIINISRFGVGLVYFTHEKLAIDSTLHLKIPVPDKMDAVHIEGEVRWTEQGVKGFNVGIEVTSELSQAELLALIRGLIRPR